jgi:hypothetical protein
MTLHSLNFLDMTKHVLLVCLFGISLNAFAQNEISFKIYQNTDVFPVTYRHHYLDVPSVTHEQKINFTRFSIAVDIPGKKINHELELFIPEISKRVNKAQFPIDANYLANERYDDKFYSVAFRYEVKKQFSKNKPVSFGLGAAINPGFTVTMYEPSMNASVFYQTHKTLNVSLNMIPRVTYVPGKKISIELNVPLKIYDFKFVETEVENPNVPYSAQKQESTDHLFFEDVYTIRLGIGYRFN